LEFVRCHPHSTIADYLSRDRVRADQKDLQVFPIPLRRERSAWKFAINFRCASSESRIRLEVVSVR
jgi:hypothetical protein